MLRVITRFTLIYIIIICILISYKFIQICINYECINYQIYINRNIIEMYPNRELSLNNDS